MGPPPGDETQLTQTSFDGSLGDDEPVAGLTVLWHADPSRVGARRPLPLLAAGRPVQVSRTQTTFATRDGIEVPLDDRSISRQPMTLRPIDRSGAIALELGDSRTRVQADGEAIGGRRVFDGASIERGVVLQLGRRTLLLLHRQPVRQPPTGPDFGLVGQSAGLTRLRDEISRLADLDLPILVRGATGTGKELVARALHDAGRRRDRPFVAVNMATVSPTLAAAELFGATRGAYTGATREKLGLFEHADGGTLFLDEIGETPPEVQPLMLRTLETGVVRP
ncbi:MAG: sigma-54 factor interaction domain-containing protein, partial [Acidobacteriota bacterium]